MIGRERGKEFLSTSDVLVFDLGVRCIQLVIVDQAVCLGCMHFSVYRLYVKKRLINHKVS